MSDVNLLDGIRAAVFDAYGTLFDVNAAVERHASTIGPQATSLSETWRTKQLEYSWIHGLMG
ncbi:MAG: HAD-IA family hydrolase, partial [Methylobacterium sp.]